MRYQQYLQTEKWQEKRKRVLERALRNANSTNQYGVCENCGFKAKKKGTMQVHHLEYPKVLGTESIDTLVLLCKKCHAEAHRNPDKFKEKYLKKVRKRMEEKRIEFEIKRSIGVLADNGTSVRKELNLISWNGAEPTLDLRSWGRENGAIKPLKGMTLSVEEAKRLSELLNGYFAENTQAV